MSERYVIIYTLKEGERAIYYKRQGKAVGIPIAFLRDEGMEWAGNDLVERANKGSRRKSIYNRRILS